MTKQWCQVTYDLIATETCDALLIPAFVAGVGLGVVVTAVIVSILIYLKVKL